MSFTPIEVLRLKHETGRSIRWRGLTSSEVVALTDPTIEQWQRLYSDFDRSHGRGAGFAFLAVGAILYYLVGMHAGWYSALAVAIFMWGITLLSKREGRREGAGDGYAVGLERGVCLALGISDDAYRDLCELALEMERDEHVLRIHEERRR